MILCSVLLFAASPVRPSLQHALDATSATSADSAAASLRELLGTSGNLRALFGTADSLSRNSALRSLRPEFAIGTPGVYSLGLSEPGGDPLVVVTLESLGAMRGKRLDDYRVGAWPAQERALRGARYAPPAGFIAVTPENESTLVSKRFFLSDFLTHDQQGVWPKVLVLRTPLLDKLELIGDELEQRGLSGSLHIMSGFRTPQYNAQGVGKGGRAGASRHMYGDAADVFVDADGDGVMDDLDGDGKITIRDARVLFAVAEAIEARHPELIGGLSAYPANGAHGPFVHVDVRGVRARW